MHHITAIFVSSDILFLVHSCYGNDEECLALCVAMVNCVLWLFSCIHQSLLKLTELKTSVEHSSTIDKACDILKDFIESTFFKALLYVGKHEDQGRIHDYQISF